MGCSKGWVSDQSPGTAAEPRFRCRVGKGLCSSPKKVRPQLTPEAQSFPELRCASCGFGTKIAWGRYRWFSSSSPLQGIWFWKSGSAGRVSTHGAQADAGHSHGGPGVLQDSSCGRWVGQSRGQGWSDQQDISYGVPCCLWSSKCLQAKHFFLLVELFELSKPTDLCLEVSSEVLQGNISHQSTFSGTWNGLDPFFGLYECHRHPFMKKIEDIKLNAEIIFLIE